MKVLKLSVVLQLLLVFASGAFVGGLGYRLFVVRAVPEVGQRPPGPPDRGKRFRQRYLDEMKTRLKLREDQFKKLTEIMDATGHRFFEEKKRSDAAMKGLQEHQMEQIRAILDPPQVAEYEKMLLEREKRMKRDRGPGRDDKDGPGRNDSRPGRDDDRHDR